RHLSEFPTTREFLPNLPLRDTCAVRNDSNFSILRNSVQENVAPDGEKAAIGVLISMEPPTKPMLKEAAEAGFYRPPGLTDKYPRIQILSIAELLVGKKIDYPRFALDATYKKAPRSRKAAEEQIPLAGAEVE